MAEYTLKNSAATVKIDEHASEIHSFKKNDSNLEYMWQGDPKYWSGRNPTLFPMVGHTWDNIIHLHGKEYTMGNHGFTRRSEFTCIEHDDEHLVMELKDNEETRKQYPYAFTLHITYTLKDTTLVIHYEITNDSDETMPFNFGLHPAFNCPLDQDKSFEDYHLELNHPDNVPMGDRTLEQAARIPLDQEALNATIIIPQPKSTEASLTDGTHKVAVHYEGYEWVAFWSPKAPFVCIEPWHSHTDFGEVKVPFEQREGTTLLAAKERWTTDYSIRVE